jgi:ATP/maltotriose-dependent transcriptional regulator MalT
MRRGSELVALILGPMPAAEGARRCEQLLREATGDFVLELNAVGALAYFVAIQGRSAEAQQLLSRAHRVTAELGEGLWVPPFCYALIAVWEADPIAAERELRPGYEVLRRTGKKSAFTSVGAGGLAQALYTQGRYDEAEELARETREASRPNRRSERNSLADDEGRKSSRAETKPKRPSGWRATRSPS